MDKFKYTTSQAVAIAASLEPHMAAIGVHVAVGGSCIYNGGSNKDMDIFLYPHKQEPLNREQIVVLLGSLGYRRPEGMNPLHGTMVPDVYVAADAEGMRVDFFFLSR